VLVTAVYLIAASMNFAGLYGSYTLAEALREDLLTFEGVRDLVNTREFLDGYSYASQRAMALIVHLVVAAVVLFVVWFGRLLNPLAMPLDPPE
jgi:nitrate reductase gamma subunit